jgi:predicted nucleotide-binding protein (sugar kinase/HSP70/actin superfamily)
MKITYPHMGNLYIAVRALLVNLGLDPVLPPPTSRKTALLGVRHAPEFACFPLKLNLGNFLEAREMGADTVLMAGGIGPCRFGYYAEVEREILADLGLSMEMVVLEPPSGDWGAFKAGARSLIGDCSWWQMLKAIRFAWYKARAVDALESKLLYLRPRLYEPLQLEAIYREALRRVDQAENRKGLDLALRDFLKDTRALPGKPGDLLRVGLVGEIFTVLEPYANYDIERHLGLLGVEVTRSIFLSEWINEHLFGGLLRVGGLEHLEAAAAPYLNAFVGGHGRETVGATVHFAGQGYDGVVQVAPFTCMPEIVAHSVLPAVTRDHGIPVLSFYLDEQSGVAGIVTRLEAFVDLLEARRKKRLKEGV